MSKPPDSKPYELAVLRGAFAPDIAREVARKATSKLFSDPETLSMFRAFQKLHFSRTPVTRESILLEMQTAAEFPEENILALVDVVLEMPEPTGIVRLIDGLGVLRGRQMLHDLTEYLGTQEALTNGMSGAVAKINEFTAGMHMVTTKRPETLSETMSRMLQRTEPSKVWLPGFGRLDNYWKIRKGSYGVIGADSGTGKTAMLIQMALNIARQDTNVGIISIEMTKDEVCFRAAAMDAGIDSERIEDNTLTDQERQQIEYTLQVNKRVYDRIIIMDDATVTSEELHGKYNELISRYGCEVIMIDYIQRIGLKGRSNGKVDVVSASSEAITAITKATGVATIALSVLNESSSAFDSAKSSGGKRRKGLSNLKEARQIGHDAHWVVILTAEDGADPMAESRYIIVESVKNRKGKWFMKPLLFHGPTQRFSDDGSDVERT
jgi:replicative DNA helicase